MNPPLLRLLMMRLRGGFRMRLIQLTSLRGLLFFLAFGGIIWLLIVTNTSSSDMGYLTDAAPDRQALSAQISTFEPNYEGSLLVHGPAGGVCSALGDHSYEARAGHHH